MEIVKHPHPALRYKSVPVTRIDAVLRSTVSKMFELMYEANGIGLAANQVALPFRFFIVNLQADAEAKDEEFVFINPVIRNKKGNEVAEEGCLSLPGLFADVRRPVSLTIEAYDLDGQSFEMKLDELPARVVQHELDHLDGIMFTDKLVSPASVENVARMDDFEQEYRNAQDSQTMPSDDVLRRQLAEMAKSGVIAN